MATTQFVYHMHDLTKVYPGGRKCFENMRLNFLPGVQAFYDDDDAQNSSTTQPYEKYVWEELDDLLPLFGAAPKTGPGETASAEQRAKAREQKQDDKVLPEKPLSFTAFNTMDTDVRFRAEQVKRRRPSRTPQHRAFTGPADER